MNAITKPTANFPGAEIYIAKYLAKRQPQRDFVEQPPQRLDRITFNTPDDDVLAGYVSVIRQHLGNGERFAWVELDNALPGSFRGVPLADILSSDDCGSVRRYAELNRGYRSLCLADFSNVFVEIAGPIFEGNADAERES